MTTTIMRTKIMRTPSTHLTSPRRTRRQNRMRAGLGLAAAGVLVATALAIPASASAESTSQGRPAGLDARTATLYLTDLAPAGRTVGGYSGQQTEGAVSSSYRLDRGAGPVDLGLNVQQLGLTPAEVRDLYSCDGLQEYLTCSVKRDVDGSYLLRATSALPRGGVAVRVDLLRGDGTRILVLTGNTADSKYGGAVHGRGVSVKDATGIVQSPLWQLDSRPPAADVARAKREIRPWTLLPS